MDKLNELNKLKILFIIWTKDLIEITENSVKSIKEIKDRKIVIKWLNQSINQNSESINMKESNTTQRKYLKNREDA